MINYWERSLHCQYLKYQDLFDILFITDDLELGFYLYMAFLMQYSNMWSPILVRAGHHMYRDGFIIFMKFKVSNNL